MYIMYRLSIYSNVLKYFMETWLFYLKKKNSLNPLNSIKCYSKVTQRLLLLKKFSFQEKHKPIKSLNYWVPRATFAIVYITLNIMMNESITTILLIMLLTDAIGFGCLKVKK